MEVTREIGVRYLWVDALCIEQDHRIDIANQIANMHNMFGSAYVTLVAAQGRSTASGLTGTSNKPRSRNVGQKVVRYAGKPLTREIGPGSFYGLVARRRKLLEHGIRDSTKTMFTSCSDVRDSKWHTRAWTMQEGLLSERCLIFMDDQVFWHCKIAVWCEPKPGREKDAHGFAVDARYAPLHDITSHLHFAQKNLDRESSRAQHYGQSPAMVSSSAYKLYKDMVESCTQRDVGKASDKLVAFNGISNIVEQCLQTHLHYGLPESLIDVALLWQPAVTLQRIHGADFPSWSWAGFQGAIQYQYHQAISATGVRQHNTIGDLEERVRPIVKWHKATGDGMFKPIDGAGFKTYDSESYPHGRYLFNRVNQTQTHNFVHRTPSLALRAFAMQANFIAQKPADPWFSAEAMSNVDLNHDKLSFNRVANYFCIYSASNKDKVIGELIFDDVEDAVSLLRHHHEIDFIAISNAQVFRSHRMNHEPRGDLYARPFDYTLYNVMAIRRLPNSDAVERIGLGRMFQDEWHQSRPAVDWVDVC